jgi:hypothetical protein
MFDLPTFTLIHVLLSVFGLIAGLVVAGGLISGARLDGWTALFLATTVATSITGYGFPADKVLPSHIVGGISLVALAICLWARYGQKMSGRWRRIYVVTAVTALYLNAFVLMVQLFVKTPALQKLAPTQQEAPFALTQGLVLLLFVWIGWKASRGFRG